MADSGYNETWPPTEMIPPPAGRPPNQIGWRPMIINWFGTMFFIGLCSPLIVWMVVYCIRTHDKGNKKKKKEVLETPSKENTQQEIKPQQGWIAPASDAKKPKTKRMSKRDHFCRYLGWWSASDPAKPDENGPQRLRGEPTDPNFVPEPRPWSLALQRGRMTSLENLAERGQLGIPLPSIQEVLTPCVEVTKSSGVDIPQNERRPATGQTLLEDEQHMMSGGLGSSDESENNTVRKRRMGRVQADQWANLSQILSRSATKRLLITPETPRREEEEAQEPLSGLDFCHHEDETTLAITPPTKTSNEPSKRFDLPCLRKVYSSPALRLAFKEHKSPDRPLFRASAASLHPHQASAPILLYHFREELYPAKIGSVLKDTTNINNECSGYALANPLSRYRNAQKPSHSYKLSVSPSKLPSTPRSKKATKTPEERQFVPSTRSFSWDVTRRSTLDVSGFTKGEKSGHQKAFEESEGKENELAGYEQENSSLDAETLTKGPMRIKGRAFTGESSFDGRSWNEHHPGAEVAQNSLKENRRMGLDGAGSSEDTFDSTMELELRIFSLRRERGFGNG